MAFSYLVTLYCAIKTLTRVKAKIAVSKNPKPLVTKEYILTDNRLIIQSKITKVLFSNYLIFRS